MDLAVYARVLSRYRKLLAVGLFVAVVLAFAAVARFELDGVKPSVSYRTDEVWISASTLFVTQQGFPWGRARLDETQGDPGRYPGLAQLYAALATSDVVERAVLTDAPRNGTYEAEVVRSTDSTVLPLVYMKGYGPSAGAAEEMANRSAEIFRRYLAAEQTRSGIPSNQRVKVALLSEASAAELFAGRSMARPVFVFVLVLMTFVALAFVLDNMRGSGTHPDGWRAALGRLSRSPSGATWRPGRLETAEESATVPSTSLGRASATDAEVRKRGFRRPAPPAGSDDHASDASPGGQPLTDESPAERRSA